MVSFYVSVANVLITDDKLFDIICTLPTPKFGKLIVILIVRLETKCKILKLNLARINCYAIY